MERQLDNGYTLHIEQRDGAWECDVIAPDGTIADTLEPVDGVGSMHDAWANGVWRSAELASEQAA